MGEMASQAGLVFSICHVFAIYAVFHNFKGTTGRETIGQLMSIQHNGTWAIGIRRTVLSGNWRRKEDSSPMILAKSCHDLDILLWLADSDCLRVSSLAR